MVAFNKELKIFRPIVWWGECGTLQYIEFPEPKRVYFSFRPNLITDGVVYNFKGFSNIISFSEPMRVSFV